MAGGHGGRGLGPDRRRGLGEVSESERVTQRNGYRERSWATRAGELELRIPRLRQGSYFPSFLEPRRRAEQALVAVVPEAYVNGVSTRKVDRLVEQMGVHMSKEPGLAALPRPGRAGPGVPGAPVGGPLSVCVAGRQDRTGTRRWRGAPRSALVIAYAVHETGRREVIGLDVGEAETEAFWREFLRSRVRARGLTGVPALRLRLPPRAAGRDRGRCWGRPGSVAPCISSENMLGHWVPRASSR